MAHYVKRLHEHAKGEVEHFSHLDFRLNTLDDDTETDFCLYNSNFHTCQPRRAFREGLTSRGREGLARLGILGLTSGGNVSELDPSSAKITKTIRSRNRRASPPRRSFPPRHCTSVNRALHSRLRRLHSFSMCISRL